MNSNVPSTLLKARFGSTRTNLCSGQFAPASLNHKPLTNVRLGSETAEEAVLRLLAAKLFDDADAVINRAIQSWDDPQLHALRRRIADERQEHERAEAITRVSAEVQALIRDEKIQEALDRAQSAVREYGDVPELTGLVGAAAALKRAEVDSVLREAAHLAEAFEFDGAIALLMETSQEFPGEDGLRAEVEALRIRQIDHDRSRAEELIRNRRLEEAAAVSRRISTPAWRRCPVECHAHRCSPRHSRPETGGGNSESDQPGGRACA